jgi:hypothetical protein
MANETRTSDSKSPGFDVPREALVAISMVLWLFCAGILMYVPYLFFDLITLYQDFSKSSLLFSGVVDPFLSILNWYLRHIQK